MDVSDFYKRILAADTSFGEPLASNGLLQLSDVMSQYAKSSFQID
jgi:hypothetical protein